MFTDTITYNRRERRYELVNTETGELLYFPPGPSGKAQAFRQAVELFTPDLFAAAMSIIQKHPQLERVTWKATELVMANGVELVMANGILAMINSSDGMGRYAVTSDNGYTACQCEHFTGMAAPMTQEGHPYCKHILAYHLWLICRAEF